MAPKRHFEINWPLKTTEEDDLFLDVDPDYFKIVLHWLRFGKIATNDATLLKGAMDVASGLGLKELVAELNNINPKKKSYPEMIHLRFRPEAPIIIYQIGSQAVMTTQGLGNSIEAGLWGLPG